MKRSQSFFNAGILLFSGWLFLSAGGDMCNKNSRELVKKELKPYYYSSMKTMSVFTSDKKEYHHEVRVPLFSGEKYRFVFNIEGINDHLNINIYDKPKGEKRRRLVYSTESAGKGQSIYVFQPKVSDPLYVDFHFEKTEQVQEGCIMMMLGYKFH